MILIISANSYFYETFLNSRLRLVSEFEAGKLEREAKKHWDKFYMRNTTNFFKDRHWTEREFPELNPKNWPNEKFKILECGCGVGNFIFPILESSPNVEAFSFDFSPRGGVFLSILNVKLNIDV